MVKVKFGAPVHGRRAGSPTRPAVFCASWGPARYSRQSELVRSVLRIAAVLLLTGCFSGDITLGAPCLNNEHCGGGSVCIDNVCGGVAPTDAGSTGAAAGTADVSTEPGQGTTLPEPTDPSSTSGSSSDDVPQEPSSTSGADPTAESETDDGFDPVGCIPIPRARARSAGVTVHAGDKHTCVLYGEGQLKCWGLGAYGALGYGDTETVGATNVPAEVGDVPVGANATSVELGWITCVTSPSCGVQCWGLGLYGATGQGNTNTLGDNEEPSSIPPVMLEYPVKKISVGAFHSCALLESGDVYCWGRNLHGELGLGFTSPVSNTQTPLESGPATLALDAPIIDVAVGELHTCALVDGGRMACWGFGERGELGYGSPEWIGNDAPLTGLGYVPLGEDREVVAMALGRHSTCALTEPGEVYCWGQAEQLGIQASENIGDDEEPSSAGPVDLGEPAVQITSGRYHTCALLESGSVRCWGKNLYGQLGLGKTEKVGDDESPADEQPVPLGDVALQLSAGGHHTCAVLEGGGIKCWGRNDSGQLGYGHTNDIGDFETPGDVGPVPWE